jgi:preprotein translocase subunit SecB
MVQPAREDFGSFILKPYARRCCSIRTSRGAIPSLNTQFPSD